MYFKSSAHKNGLIRDVADYKLYESSSNSLAAFYLFNYDDITKAVALRNMSRNKEEIVIDWQGILSDALDAEHKILMYLAWEVYGGKSWFDIADLDADANKAAQQAVDILKKSTFEVISF